MYNLQSQRTCYALGDRVVTPVDAGDGVVAPGAFERSAYVNEALQYLGTLMFSALHSLLEQLPPHVKRRGACGLGGGDQVPVRKSEPSCGVLESFFFDDGNVGSKRSRRIDFSGG